MFAITREVVSFLKGFCTRTHLIKGSIVTMCNDSRRMHGHTDVYKQVYITVFTTDAEYELLNSKEIPFRMKSDILARCYKRTGISDAGKQYLTPRIFSVYLNKWEKELLADTDISYNERSNIFGRGRQRFITDEGNFIKSVRKVQEIQWKAQE